MKPYTLDWINKAEGDFYSAQREYRARKHPNYDSACFHAQQCVEKYLKAYLVENDITFPRTHDLTNLLSLLEPIDPTLLAYLESVRRLTDYAVEFRYPGDFAAKEDARDALHICKSLRNAIRQRFGMNN